MKLADVQMSLKGDKLIKICMMFFKRKRENLTKTRSKREI